MTIELIVGVIGIAFIVLVIFFIITLQGLRKTAERTEQTMKEAHHLLRELSEPTVELIENTNKLVEDVKKKCEALDVLFHPLNAFRNNRSEKPNGLEKICCVLGFVEEGIQLYKKIKKEMK